MIAIKSWIERLITRCAKTNEKNTFTDTQTFSNQVVLKNDSYNSREAPTSNNSGVTHRIVLFDTNERLLGSIDCYRTLSDSIGIRFTIKNKYLGFQLSDEGIATSFVEHPYEHGPDNQIATIKYVDTKDNLLLSEIGKLTTLIENNTSRLNETILRLDAITQLIYGIDNYPVNGSQNLVYSNGIYNFVKEIEAQLRKEIQEAVGQGTSSVGWTLGPWKELHHHWSGTDSYTFNTGGFIIVHNTYENPVQIWINDVLIASRTEHEYAVCTPLTVAVPKGATVRYQIDGDGNTADSRHQGCVHVAEFQ